MSDTPEPAAAPIPRSAWLGLAAFALGVAGAVLTFRALAHPGRDGGGEFNGMGTALEWGFAAFAAVTVFCLGLALGSLCAAVAFARPGPRRAVTWLALAVNLGGALAVLIGALILWVAGMTSR